MIRYTYINNLVLSIYNTLPVIQFPIDVKEVIKYIPNCRYMSYQQFAEVNHCSISDVIQICESKSGCTHYDILQDRYLILCNQSTQDNNNSGRQRWTCSHEIGHILCKHHSISAYEKLSENSLLPHTNNQYFEAEADYFATTLLAPFPLFSFFNIQSAIDIQNVFGLSCEASLYRFKQYMKWKNNHRKTAWENDMKHIFQYKSNHT
ncbi:MAG: ImmA/IrrE family metallo-endopeptidase [Erysipelotrichaceae bacterium]|nr:ImmA/IrrE family metallo-endopeptidase [Erysipelotrichaceae bacterium]